MSLLDNLVGQVLKNSLGNTHHQPQADGLGGLLGQVLGSQAQQGGLGGLLGQLAQSQMQPQANGLGGVLGSLLGAGQPRQSVPAGD